MTRNGGLIWRSCRATSNRLVFAISLILAAGAGDLLAGTIYVPNGSFEGPSTVYVDTAIDSWRKSPMPDWYDASAYGPWDQLAGVFLNPAADSTNNDHIVNCDGAQAAFLFALPGVALSQDLAARFQPGRNYSLTVAVLGNGGGMSIGVPLAISFYYRDASSNAVTIATTTVTNSAALFPDRNHFIDFTVSLPAVAAGDPRAGGNIGVQIASTVGFDLVGGYWDVDNARVTESIAIPNFSFEAPATDYVDTDIRYWQKSPAPYWYDESAYGPWGQLTGVFLNTPADSTNNDHIVNCDGAQAAFLFAMPGVALSQDNVSSSNAFNVKFEQGKSYQFTVGALGNGGGMSDGVTLQIGLYYLDAASNAVTVASTTITNSATLFPNRTNLVDFSVMTPPVKATDAWAGKNIGVEIVSTVGFALAGGYWDVDNARLVSYQSPVLSAAGQTGGQLSLSLLSEPGLNFDVLATTNVASGASGWTNIGSVTNTTGNSTVTNTTSGASQRFYRIRQLP